MPPVRSLRVQPAIRTLDPETGELGPVLITHPRVEPGARLANYRRGGRDPGTFYLYDADKQRMGEIGRVRPRIKPAQMAEMKPIRFRARDGVQEIGNQAGLLPEGGRFSRA